MYYSLGSCVSLMIWHGLDDFLFSLFFGRHPAHESEIERRDFVLAYRILREAFYETKSCVLVDFRGYDLAVSTKNIL